MTRKLRVDKGFFITPYMSWGHALQMQHAGDGDGFRYVTTFDARSISAVEWSYASRTQPLQEVLSVLSQSTSGFRVTASLVLSLSPVKTNWPPMRQTAVLTGWPPNVSSLGPQTVQFRRI